jgi:hypothetical protein
MGVYKLPIREHQEIALNPREWMEVDPYETIAKKKSLALFGCAGTGKTFLARELIEILRGEGKRVAVVSKTHVAAIQLGGVTANHFAYKHILHSSYNGDYLVIDEVSQIEIGLWIQLAKLSFMGVKFILLGDFNQHHPIGGHIFAGKILDDECIERSCLLKILADCNRCTLTECKRSDQQLFDFYSSLIPNGSRFEVCLETLLEEARKMFPRKKRVSSLLLSNLTQNEATHKHQTKQ